VSQGHRQNVNSLISGMSSDLTKKDRMSAAPFRGASPKFATRTESTAQELSVHPLAGIRNPLQLASREGQHFVDLAYQMRGASREPVTEARVRRPTMIRTGKRYS
jgi:hypothetical protein